MEDGGPLSQVEEEPVDPRGLWGSCEAEAGLGAWTAGLEGGGSWRVSGWWAGPLVPALGGRGLSCGGTGTLS